MTICGVGLNESRPRRSRLQPASTASDATLPPNAVLRWFRFGSSAARRTMVSRDAESTVMPIACDTGMWRCRYVCSACASMCCNRRLRPAHRNRRASGGLPGVHAFRDLLDHLAIEVRQVVRLATRHEPRVDYDGLVDPLRPRVAQVRADRRIGRDPTAPNDIRLDEKPRAVTDGGHGLASLEEGTGERDGALIRAQAIRIHHAARQDESVEVVCIRTVERKVDLERLPPVLHVPRPDLVLLRRNDDGLRTGVAQRLDGRRELDLLESVVYENGNALAFELLCHAASSFCVNQLQNGVARLMQACGRRVPPAPGRSVCDGSAFAGGASLRKAGSCTRRNTHTVVPVVRRAIQLEVRIQLLQD